ncbi:dipeptide epimerase [Shewanella sp. D64]|uniref:dipeptide epimerase n=1 Tax=unclassified Shewanella TaxID=196818 RepID=UPI0022BA3B14|nr:MULTISPECIES: dipeptide epimerase [unclassified Shewanella]MEC4727069.1 dipeptide epimerase [Shewanella sp. D64]MEC4737808.1 dipeptide epimerase [Shewanella sp. E94]WBJ93935.1 dipeptide epimerase [Shewanella sp. MTB7]
MISSTKLLHFYGEDFELLAVQQSIPLKQVFRIARGAKNTAQVIVVIVKYQGLIGWGESVPYRRYGETVASAILAIKAVCTHAKQFTELADAISTHSQGAAQNALDCAYLDLQAKITGKTANVRFNLPNTRAVITAQTLSIDTPEAMAEAARLLIKSPLIKVKLDNIDIIDKMTAIHNMAPHSQFIVDANEAWSIEDLRQCAEELAALNVVLIEQPLPAGNDEALTGLNIDIALCADESCHTVKDLPFLSGKYDVVNIKLDKTGGLTEAVTLAAQAKLMGFDIMLGCMVGSSLAMAPAFLLSPFAKYIDLDGPLLVKEDRLVSFEIDNGLMQPFNEQLWGGVNPEINIEANQLLEL